MDAPSSPNPRSALDPLSASSSGGAPSEEAERVVAEAIESTRRYADACSLEYAHAAAIVATCLLRAAAEEKPLAESSLPVSDKNTNIKLLSEVFRSIDTEEGRLRVFVYLTSGPYPRFHALPGAPGYLLRTEFDGAQTIGRFVGREFETVKFADLCDALP